jgi:hypothetical protein
MLLFAPPSASLPAGYGEADVPHGKGLLPFEGFAAAKCRCNARPSGSRYTCGTLARECRKSVLRALPRLSRTCISFSGTPLAYLALFPAPFPTCLLPLRSHARNPSFVCPRMSPAPPLPAVFNHPQLVQPLQACLHEVSALLARPLVILPFLVRLQPIHLLPGPPAQVLSSLGFQRTSPNNTVWRQTASSSQDISYCTTARPFIRGTARDSQNNLAACRTHRMKRRRPFFNPISSI